MNIFDKIITRYFVWFHNKAWKNFKEKHKND